MTNGTIQDVIDISFKVSNQQFTQIHSTKESDKSY